MPENILEIKNLNKVYPDGTKALKNINFKAKKGEFIVVIGPSGAGKSTLLRSINRLSEPTDGEIIFLGENILKANKGKLRKIRRHIGMIFQGFNLVKRLPTVRNVLHGRLGYMSSIKGAFGMFDKNDVQKALEVLERVGLEEQAFKRADELSGGQQQRVAIARAINQSPSLILADEPIASLDPNSSQIVMDYLRKVCDEDGLTTIVNLHQVDIAKEYADRIIGVKDGEIFYDGSPRGLTDEVIQKLYRKKEALHA
ncbi:phosphonate ABC transporter ATP-binding protein [Halalkalibacter alkaliphilus]|uniref:Phosphonate ABC transporter ATP-binding protein n=1 Tax=Halalkalibacter alkaliphilus TaxID=2917993 RepID=A0A9X1ZWJ4_9BACI|nr:phosphonate ABC transporter ATP-binding protein [Halalkalibacter alkaliphilus]MCL7746854.1 phosphonate ABC transporter ATP-binding protein [Halalkalibacter alkaliphilus]